MLSSRSVDEICEIIGRKGGTRTRDLVRGLRKLGFPCLSKLQKLREPLPEISILHLRFYDTGKAFHGHWSLLHHGVVYDPGLGVAIDFDSYRAFVQGDGAKITTMLPIGTNFSAAQD